MHTLFLTGTTGTGTLGLDSSLFLYKAHKCLTTIFSAKIRYSNNGQNEIFAPAMGSGSAGVRRM